MRYAYAKWLVEFTEEHGFGLEPGEFAEIEEAEFRVYGTSRLYRSDLPKIRSEVKLEGVAPWEREILTSVAHELIATLADAGEIKDPRGT